MTQTQKKSLAFANAKVPVVSKTHFNNDLSRSELQMFGDGLWTKFMEICNGECENTPDTALEFGVDVSTLPVEGMYYALSRFEDQDGNPLLQILLAMQKGSKKCYYASILRDKDGEQILSDENVYVLNEVVANRDFTIQGTDVKIPAGQHFLKAYAE